jgi:hypothetical protein
MSLFPKFVVEGDNLIIAKCTYHHQLVIETEKVKGGGMWSLNRDANTFTLSGDSHDFGRASIDDIKNCIEKGNVFRHQYSDVSMVDKFNFVYQDECGEKTELKTIK